MVGANVTSLPSDPVAVLPVAWMLLQDGNWESTTSVRKKPSLYANSPLMAPHIYRALHFISCAPFFLIFPICAHTGCKETVFELSLRIPFIIHDPLAAPTAVGGSTRVFAENIDIYRTLATLAGVPDVEAGVDGVSLAPLLREPATAEPAMLRSKPAAFGQHARCLRNATNGYAPINPFKSADSCTVTPRQNLDWMGYSIRTDNWRFTAWVGWNGTSLTPIWGRVNATELYAHTVEPGGPSDQDFDAWENDNLAGRPEHATVERQLHTMLTEHFDEFALPYQELSEVN